MAILKHLVLHRRADLLMTVMVLVWGLHFVVVKDAVAEIAPLTFNALRFLIGLPLIALMAWHERRLLRLSRRDVALIALLTLTGPVFYQVGFALGIKRTTSTNTALLMATMPAWTALFSMLTGLVEVRRQLVIGLTVTLAGIVLVVFSRSGGGFGLSHDDMVGSGILLFAAVSAGIANVVNKPVVDRLGAVPLAIWKYNLTALGLSLLALPDLLHLSAADVPLRAVPNLLYSGLLAGVGGYIVTHYALRAMDPTRSSSYYNFNPIVAALAGILILGEPFSGWLLAGGALTVGGVIAVRRNIFKRQPRARSELD